MITANDDEDAVLDIKSSINNPYRNQTKTLSMLTSFCQATKGANKKKTTVRLENVKSQVAISIDDNTFNQLVKDSNVCKKL